MFEPKNSLFVSRLFTQRLSACDCGSGFLLTLTLPLRSCPLTKHVPFCPMLQYGSRSSNIFRKPFLSGMNSNFRLVNTNLVHTFFNIQQYICYITLLNMFQASRCSSSGGPIVSPLPLVSSPSVSSRIVCSPFAYSTAAYRG